MIANTNWPRVKTLFQQALDQPPGQRDAWLLDACGGDEVLIADVNSLLAAHVAPDRVVGGVAQLMSPLTAQDAAPDELGTQIGAYRLVRLLGAGGMGRVYLAERADGQFKHLVALKLVRAEVVTPELGSRFLRERDTLSQLNHPNIAQLHDGGVTTAGAPYFTLEYVDGKPITTWCDELHRTVRERVQVMLKVCDAVEHAHRNLIVHRDIKPSNILVAPNGEPKLLDFGIAKPLERPLETELTGSEVRPMTREYAAPEQILGERVTTATDVYSLGVLLYLLLCGRMPYRNAALGKSPWTKSILEEKPETLTRAVHREPMPDSGNATFFVHATSETDLSTLAASRSTTPRALSKSLGGDLERIIQRALAKSPTSRYPTVAALMADLRAYLDGRAIAGGTRTYRARKFVANYWIPISAAAVLIVVILGSAAIMVLDARKIEHEAQTTTSVKEFLVDLFSGADPHESNGKDITARDLVARGVDRITKLPNQPMLRGELESVLGEINNDLHQYDDAARLQKLSLDDLRGNGGSPLLIATTETAYANSLINQDHGDDAEKIADKAIADLRAVQPQPIADLATALGLRSYIAISKHDYKSVAVFADEALAYARRPGVPKKVLAEALASDAMGAAAKHDYALQESLLRESVDVRRAQNGDSDIYVALAMMELSNAVTLDGGLKEELQLLTDATRIASAAVDEKDPRQYSIRGRYADILRTFGRYAEAEQQLDLIDRHNLTIDDKLAKLGALVRRVNVLAASEKSEAAMAKLDALDEMSRAVYGEHSPFVEQFALTRCDILLQENRVDEAEATFKDIAPMNEHGHSMSGAKRVAIEAQIDIRKGRFAEARKALENGLTREQFSHGQRAVDVAIYKLLIGTAMNKMGDFDDAMPVLRETLDAYEKSSGGAIIPGSAAMRIELAEALAQKPQTKDEALSLAKSSYDANMKFYGADNARTRRAKALVDQLDKRT